MSSELLCRYPGTTSKVLNLGSYNYLGFAESGGPCVEDVVQRIMDDGVSTCSFRKDLGSNFHHFVLLLICHMLALLTFNSLISFFTLVLLRLFNCIERARSLDCSVCWKRRCNGLWNGICYQLRKYSIINGKGNRPTHTSKICQCIS